MKVFMLADVTNIGMEGEIVKVSDGYALNYLVPRKLATLVTPENESSFKRKAKVIENRKEVIETKTSMLAEKIKHLKLTIKKKMHEGKLYGSITPSEIIDLLDKEGVKVAKNQILLDKTIKEQGSHEIVIKLSNKLQPKFTLKVVSE